MMKKNELLVTYGTDYVNMTEELLREAGLAELIGDRNRRIGIKPNLVAPVLAAEGGTTHPEVVEGLIRYLQANGFQDLTIMEGSWVGDKTEESFEVCGYNELAEKYQGKPIGAQKEPAVTMDWGGLELHILSLCYGSGLYDQRAGDERTLSDKNHLCIEKHERHAA